VILFEDWIARGKALPEGSHADDPINCAQSGHRQEVDDAEQECT